MPPAMLAAAKPDAAPSVSDGETVFGGLLLAVIGGRRLIVLVGQRESDRVGLLARVARRLELDGMMVMTVGATPGVLVEDLVEVAGRSHLASAADGLDFEALLDALEDRLDGAGSGILMVDQADRLTPDTLRDLMDLSAATTPGGNAMQILVSGGPDLEKRLAQADMEGALDTVGTIYSLDAPVAAPGAAEPRTSRREPLRPARAPLAPEGPTERQDAPARRGPGWMAVALTALAAAAVMYMVGQEPFSRAGDAVDRVARSLGQPAPTAADTPGMPPSDARVATVPDATTPPTMADDAAPGRTATEHARADDMAEGASEPPEVTEPEVGLAQPGETVADPADTMAPPPAAESDPVQAAEVEPFREPEPPVPTVRNERNADGAAAAEGGNRPAVADADTRNAQRTPAEERRILSLLAQAEAQMADRKLTTPTGDNALETLQALSEIDPGNSAIADLRRRMMETYRLWARQAERRDQWDFARTYYQRSLRVEPANREMTRLLDTIEQRRRTGEPAPAPRTAEVTPPPPAVAPARGEDGPPVPTLKP